jgi:hypothetical protein
LAAALVVVGILAPDIIPLCYVPGDAVVCPTDMTAVPFDSPRADEVVRATASAPDIAVVELAGILGAAITAVVALRRLRGSSTPYDPVVVLGLLKLPVGALTAVLGLLFLRGNFVPGLSALDSSAQIIAWAVLLGAGQQLFTGLVDRQALALLGAVDAPTEQRQHSAGLDMQTAEAFTTAVSSTLRSSAPAALREAIGGQPLSNYSGAVTIQLLDDMGAELDPPERRRVALLPGRRYTFRVVIGPEARRGLAMPLKISDGIEEDAVRFGIELESNDRRVQQQEQAVTVGATEGEVAADFPFALDEDMPQRWAWVRVTQRGQVVRQIELDIATLEAKA